MTSDKSITIIRRKARTHLGEDDYERFLREEMLTAVDIGRLLDVPPPFHTVKRWRRDGHLLALPVAQGFVYPAFQIDVERRRLRPQVVAFMKARRPDDDPWNLLSRWYAHDLICTLSTEGTH